MRRADRKQVHALLDGALDPRQAEALRARAAQDPALGAYLAQMESLRGALRGLAVSSVEPPAFVAPAEEARRPLLSFALRPALAFAAVVACAAIGIIWAQRVQPSASAQVAVEFRLKAPAASQVQVAGDFSGWQPIALNRVGDEWTGALELSPGRHAYMYVVDGRWTTDPEAHSFRDDDFGRRNAVLHL